ncbi:uncharacterized protein LOC133529300 [Cydia pomonella]|uniref:uncharacterized protein LOC133529300 n=1 Tax=Cydia pomonella TaxID=82600 RepID=UPI002ADDB5BE|nr:uncharacterized protein LOC133529300 [Cydia pomonella]
MKRKSSNNDDDEYIRNKIKKLERRLWQKSRRRIRITDSSDNDSSGEDRSVSADIEPRASRRASAGQGSQQSASPVPGTSHKEQTAAAQPSRDPVRPTSPQPGPSSAPDQYVPAEPADPPEPAPSSLEDIKLDEDVLNLLGEAPKLDTPLGKGIHKDVACRWQEVLNRGLQKEVKDKLTEEYLIPNNCTLLVPPILNPEAKVALPDALIKRDTSLMLRQKQIALALSALSHAMDIVIKQKSSAPDILKPISDACRILCDSHFTETKMRRNFVISAINTDLKDTLINTERDKFLFGENVSEKLKAAQTVQKSGDTLKNTQKSYNPFNKANFIKKNRYQQNKGNLNYNTPYRKMTNYNSKSDAGRPRAAARPAPAPSSRYNTRYRARERQRERSRTPPRRYQRRQ